MKMTATVFVQKAVQETILHIMENKQSCEVGSQDKIDKTVPNSCYLKPTLEGHLYNGQPVDKGLDRMYQLCCSIVY